MREHTGRTGSQELRFVMAPPIDRGVPIPPSDGDARERLRLSLLGAFEFLDEHGTVPLSRGTQRLLAFVALQGGPVSRDVVAEALWSSASEAESHSRLRSAIWRLEQQARDSMTIDVRELELSPEVNVDLEDAKTIAHRILIEDTIVSEGDMTSAAIEALSSDLLPDWYEDWVFIRAEDWRQLRLHALETLSQELLDAGRFAEALKTAAEVRRADPLRESPHALTILIHLAEGNQSEAVKAFLAYRRLLEQEFGIEPTPQLWALISALMP